MSEPDKGVTEAANREAVVALINFVNDHYTTILDALEKMAERNLANALICESAGEVVMARILGESAVNWRAAALEMRTLVNAVWDTTPRT